MKQQYDFIIAGSGAGSMCAALKLRSEGKSVLVLEKTDLIGGTTATSGGVMWIPNNRYLAEAGIKDSREDALAYLEATAGRSENAPGASPIRRETYVDQAPAMLEFLLEQGLEFRRVPNWPDYYAAPGEVPDGRTVVSELFDLNQLGKDWKKKLRPGFIPIPAYLEEAMQLPKMKRSKPAKKQLFKILGRTLKTRLRGKHLVTAGHALQAQLLHSALKAGADVLTNAAVQELKEQQGKVTGVVANIDGRVVEISAKLGVLINAGGFARNQSMLDKYVPGVSADWSNACPGDTGEMIEQGIKLGAAIAQMNERVGSPTTELPEKPEMKPAMQGDLGKPHSIVVNQSGQRFMRESSSYMAISKAILEQGSTPSWLVLDSQYLEKYWLLGGSLNKKKRNKLIRQGVLLEADSIEVLAKQCDIDPAALNQTVNRFNGFVEAGKDADFNRGSHAYDRWLGDDLQPGQESLGKIEQAPFYAVRIYPGDLGTFGGLLTDEHARVLKEDGSAIEGLYATGTSTASVMGRVTPGAGGSIGPAMTFAYVAACHAVTQNEN